jgi:signal transduction histidine kinase
MQHDTIQVTAAVRNSEDALREQTGEGRRFVLIILGLAASALLILAAIQCRHLNYVGNVMWSLLAFPAFPRKNNYERSDQDEKASHQGFPLSLLLQSIFQNADGVLNSNTATFAFKDTETGQQVTGRLQHKFPMMQLLRPGRLPHFHWWRSDWRSVTILNINGDLDIVGLDHNWNKLDKVHNTLKPSSVWNAPFNRLVIAKLQPDQRWEGHIAFCDPQLPKDDFAAASLLHRMSQTAIKNYQMHLHASTQARMEERLRIARDLHDGVMQSLSISAMRMEEIRRDSPGRLNAKTSKALAEAHELLTSEIRRLRLQAEQLRSDFLSEPLVPHLEQLIKEFERRTGITTVFTCDINPELISDTLALDLVYMIREALSNVCKHSQSKFVSVDLSGKQSIRLTINDCGKGFAKDTANPQNTAKSPCDSPRVLHERVAAVGGSLLVQSTQQRGTRLTISIPNGKRQSRRSRPTDNSTPSASPDPLSAPDRRKSPRPIELADLRYLRKK